MLRGATWVALAIAASGCTLALGGVCEGSEACPSGFECVGSRCIAPGTDAGFDAGFDAGPSMTDAGPDAGPGTDGGFDAGPVPDDAGPPAHCSNGTLDPGIETDVDCGADCPACGQCRMCTGPQDCLMGGCIGGRCEVSLSSVPTTSGTRDLFVREDGYILLAYYAPGTFPAGFDFRTAFRATNTGGSVAGAGFAPTPCGASGHVPFDDFDPNGRELLLECGEDYSMVTSSVGSSTLFTDFANGTRGTPTAPGTPGWAALAEAGTGEGRTGGAMCGINGGSNEVGGISYCDGPRGSGYDNHLVSFSTDTRGGSPFVGCGGVGCNGAACRFGVWVWLAP